MQKYVLDTNFFITGYQSQPQKYKIFGELCDKLGVEIIITSQIRYEMRHFLQREIVPYITVENIDHDEFNEYMRKAARISGNLPQKNDMTVIYLADKIGAPVVSSDLRLLEVAEDLGLKAFANSAFVKMFTDESLSSKEHTHIKELEAKLFTEEIRYSVSSSNRYDPVKRIQKIVDSAISVIRTEYEQKIEEKTTAGDAEDTMITIEGMQVRELTYEIQRDFKDLEKDFKEGKFAILEKELITRVRELTDLLVDWKLAVDDIENHKTYNAALEILGRLQYLVCISLIENKKVELARVYMDKLVMILLENTGAVESYGMDVHFLRMVILLLSGQIHRLTSYFTPAFQETCVENQREDILNLIPALILLTVVIGRKEIEETAEVPTYESIEFINQLGFKFFQLEALEEASLMFQQTFYLSLNSDNTGLAIASLEYLTWLHFSGLDSLKQIINIMYSNLIKQKPKIKNSYSPNLEIEIFPSKLESFVDKEFVDIEELPREIKAPWYCIGQDQLKRRGKGSDLLVKVINWEINARIGIKDENRAILEKSSLGSTIYPIKGKIKLEKPTAYVRRKYDIELIIEFDDEDPPAFIFRSAGGWDCSGLN